MEGKTAEKDKSKKWYLFERYLYWNYRKFYTFGKWMQLRFSPSGRMLAVLTGITGALGADTTSSVTYQAFSLLLILLTGSFFMSFSKRWKVTVRRHAPSVGSVGEECSYFIDVDIKSKNVTEGVYVVEHGPDPRPNFMEFAEQREPLEYKRNIIDRFYAYYRWKWLISSNEMLNSNAIQKFTLYGDRTNRLTVKITPKKRGLLNLTELYLGIPSATGLTYSIVKKQIPDSMLILPERVPINRYEFPGVSSPESGTMAKGLFGGSEDEFLSLRDYRPGDPLKQIHWPSSAKTKKLIVKETQNVSRARCGIILDVSCKAEDALEFEKLISIATSIACQTEDKPIDLDFLFVGQKAHCFSTGPGQGDLDQLMKILATIQYESENSWEPLTKAVEENSEKIQGAVFLTMHDDDKRSGMIKYLDQQGIPNQMFVLSENSQHYTGDLGFKKKITLCRDNYKQQLQELK